MRFDETLYGGDDDRARRRVSDHRPVWAEFVTDLGDDDGPGSEGRVGFGATRGLGLTEAGERRSTCQNRVRPARQYSPRVTERATSDRTAWHERVGGPLAAVVPAGLMLVLFIVQQRVYRSAFRLGESAYEGPSILLGFLRNPEAVAAVVVPLLVLLALPRLLGRRAAMWRFEARPGLRAYATLAAVALGWSYAGYGYNAYPRPLARDRPPADGDPGGGRVVAAVDGGAGGGVGLRDGGGSSTCRSGRCR